MLKIEEEGAKNNSFQLFSWYFEDNGEIVAVASYNVKLK
jgi:hypothetical protein